MHCELLAALCSPCPPFPVDPGISKAAGRVGRKSTGKFQPPSPSTAACMYPVGRPSWSRSPVRKCKRGKQAKHRVFNSSTGSCEKGCISQVIWQSLYMIESMVTRNHPREKRMVDFQVDVIFFSFLLRQIQLQRPQEF